ncbi:MAG: arginine deiminase family protein [Balneolaceae bacterium]|nr:arginine deiminase family protein [Balneolaceae bacterium]
MKLSVRSESGLLQSVIVHTPGREVSLVNPEMKDELLFDDIIFEEDARQEHEGMLEVLRAAMPSDGAIYQITDLIRESFEKEEAREHFIRKLVDRHPEENIHTVEDELHRLDPAELLQFVVEGHTPGLHNFTLYPTPNLVFTRDLAAMVGDAILLSRPAMQARLREALMMEAVIQFHPLFAETRSRCITIADGTSIEGGDVLVASDRVVLIGMSERTSFSGLMRAAERLLETSVEHVLAVDIPKQRASMHLDTIFTFAAPGECLVFAPAITERRNNVIDLSRTGGQVTARTMPSLKEAMEELLEREFTFMNCGGSDRTDQFREQWTDGANVFAVAPGVVVGYERNHHTFRELQNHGYRLMNQHEFIERYRDADLPENVGEGDEKVAVSFVGHELCRGRGGARCMTMPIARKNG